MAISEKNVELHLKRLITSFWKTRVRKSTLAILLSDNALFEIV